MIINDFADFAKSTGRVMFRTPDDFLNEAIAQRLTFDRLLRGRGKDQVFQGGSTINDEVMFDEANTFAAVNPNDTLSYVQPQVLTSQTQYWRFYWDHKSWTENEITLNMNTSTMTRGAIKTQFKRLRKKIDMRCYTSQANGMEAMVWADAGGSTQYAKMEGSASGSTGVTMSIPAVITEDTTNYHPYLWTTILGIDPANEDGYRNQVETYDFDDPDDSAGNSTGLIDAFDNMVTKVDFKAPNFHKEAFEPDSGSAQQTIFCSRGGLMQYKRLLRAANDTLVRKQDAAYGNPQFDGIDLVYTSALDTATIIWNGSLSSGTASTELGATDGQYDGYRYYFVNSKYYTPIFHNEQYFNTKDPFFLPHQPWTWVQPTSIYMNCFPNSRRRHGIVAPQA